jgi:hypothetical protein
VEGDRAIVLHVDAVNEERVDVGVDLEGRTEAVQDRDDRGVGLVVGNPVPLPVVEGARDDAADVVEHVRPKSEETADLPGEAYRPLAERRHGKDVVHQVGGAVGGMAGAAGWTQLPGLA